MSQLQPRRKQARLVHLGLTAALLLAAVFAMGAPQSARADYTPAGPYYADKLGAGGTYVSNDGTNLSASDIASTWNGWTDPDQLVVGTSNNCGSSVSCIILVNDGSTITGTNCAVPEIEDYDGGTYAGSFALTFLATSNGNLCTDLSSTSYPIYIVAYNNEGGYLSTTRQHIQRHEVGHALRLGDASSSLSCWTTSGVVYPLMKNVVTNCSSYPQNRTATANEAYYAEQWAYY